MVSGRFWSKDAGSGTHGQRGLLSEPLAGPPEYAAGLGRDLQDCHLRALREGGVQLRPARGGSSVPTLGPHSELDWNPQLGTPRNIRGCGTKDNPLSL